MRYHAPASSLGDPPGCGESDEDPPNAASRQICLHCHNHTLHFAGGCGSFTDTVHKTLTFGLRVCGGLAEVFPAGLP
jgi:hypothetical protein